MISHQKSKRMNRGLSLRVLGADESEAYFRLRLEALEREPLAFGSSSDEFQSNNSVERLKERLSESNMDNFVLGAFVGDEMVGMAGFVRFTELKLRHKGRVWGVYVRPAHRGAGIGGALLRELLRIAGSAEGLAQIILAVNPGQSAARHLYERLGFETYGRETDALKVGEIFVSEDYMMLRVYRR